MQRDLQHAIIKASNAPVNTRHKRDSLRVRLTLPNSVTLPSDVMVISLSPKLFPPEAPYRCALYHPARATMRSTLCANSLCTAAFEA